jgi:hypothetical protein
MRPAPDGALERNGNVRTKRGRHGRSNVNVDGADLAGHLE